MTFVSKSRFAAAVALAGCLGLAAHGPLAARDLETSARTETEQGPAPLANPGDDFIKQFSALKKQLEALGGQIKKSAGEIESLTSPEAARKEIGTLQGLIANTLGLVTNNGDVAKLGQKVIDYARAKQKQFAEDKKFSAEERAYLQKEWQRVGTQTETAISELSKARGKLTEMLKTVQARGDFIEELQALKNANKMLEVVKTLAAELRTASTALQNFSQAAKPPAAGM